MALQNMKNQSLKPKLTLIFNNVLLPCKHYYSFRKYKSSFNQNLIFSLSDLKENDAGKIKRRWPWMLHNILFFFYFKKFGNRIIGGGLKRNKSVGRNVLKLTKMRNIFVFVFFLKTKHCKMNDMRILRIYDDCCLYIQSCLVLMQMKTCDVLLLFSLFILFICLFLTNSCPQIL